MFACLRSHNMKSAWTNSYICVQINVRFCGFACCVFAPVLFYWLLCLVLGSVSLNIDRLYNIKSLRAHLYLVIDHLSYFPILYLVNWYSWNNCIFLARFIVVGLLSSLVALNIFIDRLTASII